jgi:lipoate-protein ligase A
MWIDDQVLAKHQEKLVVHNFVPASTMVVLGSSNSPDIEVNQNFCEEQKIPVLKRYGGGGTVVLYGGCVVVSAGMWVRQHFQNQDYFQRINQVVIETLGSLNPVLNELNQKGLSDISFKGRKIAGTSLFRSRNYLLYQASLVVEPNLPLINACLLHPSKEPDYRQGRSHTEFMTSLFEICGVESGKILQHFDKHLASTLHKSLGGELIEPIPSQFSALNARLLRAQQD